MGLAQLHLRSPELRGRKETLSVLGLCPFMGQKTPGAWRSREGQVAGLQRCGTPRQGPVSAPAAFVTSSLLLMARCDFPMPPEWCPDAPHGFWARLPGTYHLRAPATSTPKCHPHRPVTPRSSFLSQGLGLARVVWYFCLGHLIPQISLASSGALPDHPPRPAIPQRLSLLAPSEGRDLVCLVLSFISGARDSVWLSQHVSTLVEEGRRGRAGPYLF